MSRLILPGDSPRPGGLTILVPRGYEQPDGPEPTMVCRVPTGDGEVCGKAFYPGEERKWQRHVGECAARHRDKIETQSPRTRLPIFSDEAWDPEISAHMRKVGDRMIREGRLEVRPNERAGF